MKKVNSLWKKAIKEKIILTSLPVTSASSSSSLSSSSPPVISSSSLLPVVSPSSSSSSSPLVASLSLLPSSSSLPLLLSSPSSLSSLSSSSPSSSPIILGKRQRVNYSSSITPNISCFCPNIDVPLQVNGSVDIFKIVKSAVCSFDQKTIAFGSFRSYKSSNHLLVDSEQNAKVPQESTYDAEMYQICIIGL